MEDLKQNENVNAQQQNGDAGQVTNPTKGEAVNAIIEKAVAQPTEKEQEERKRLQFLEQFRLTTLTEVPPERPVLTVDGVGIFARGDIHAVKAKQKQGKTSVLKVCCAALLSGEQFRLKAAEEGLRVLFIDTEQKASDAKLVATDVKAMTGLTDETVNDQLRLFALRTLTYEHMLHDIELLIQQEQPQVVIIDGVVDVVESFNDEVCSKNAIEQLMRISTEYDVSLINVLHTNKSKDDDNMRGHLGTMLAQKAGTVLECKKQGDIITVECADARHQPMPSWSVCFNKDGQLVDADARYQQILEQNAADAERRKEQKRTEELQRRTAEALRIIGSHGGSVSRKQLTEELMKSLSLGETTIKTFISQSLADKVLGTTASGLIEVYSAEQSFF